MSGFAVQGWCPDAWHPMRAGDGLLVRVRPRLARLTRAQLLGLAAAAAVHGNGLIDVTRRANLQLRGVREESWTQLLERLVEMGLVDPDPVAEVRRNILVAPDWRVDDDSMRIAADLMTRLADLPDLPGKVGFAIDAGPERQLSGEAGDFRVERGVTGELILRAEGHPTGRVVAPGDAADALVALARWFVASGGTPAGRMIRHHAELPGWARGEIAPAKPARRLGPGPHPLGHSLAVPFGQIDAGVLAGLAELAGLVAVRVAPWRLIIAEGASVAGFEGLVNDADDPLLRAEACPGAPRCPQATVETRDLARCLAPLVKGRVHVSGCAKGCAYGGPTDVMLTGSNGAYDLALNDPSGASPIRTGMTRAEILARFGAD